MSRYRIAGIIIETDWPLVTAVPQADGDAPVDLFFRVVTEPPSDWDTAPIEFGDVGDLWPVSPDEWSFHLTDPAHDYQIEVYLLGIVLSHWLERQGVAVLHGSAVGFGSGAIGFLGRNGSGKTSLALAMVDRGACLLTDDLLAAPFHDGRAFAEPTYPQVRLWPSDAERRLGTTDGLALAHPGYTKLRVPLPSHSFCPTAAPVTALYLPRRGSELAIEEVQGAAALVSLMSESYSPGLNDRPRSREAWIARNAELLEGVGVFTLSYPDTFDALPEVASAVADHATSIQSKPEGGTAASNGA